MFLLIVLVEEPARGGNEGAALHKRSSWFADVREVVKMFVKIDLFFRLKTLIGVFTL